MAATVIPLWEHQDERKRIGQNVSRLREWREQLKSAQTFVLSRTADEFKDRQAAVFVSNMAAVDLTIMLLEVSKAGLLMSPGAWEKKDE